MITPPITPIIPHDVDSITIGKGQSTKKEPNRELTNYNWRYALESADAIKAISRILKPEGIKELKALNIAMKIVRLFNEKGKK